MTRSAIVVGAGIAGLATAIGLRRVGWNVLVLERYREVRPIGAGLSLAPNALRALDAIGVGSQVRTVGVPTAAASAIRRPSGRYLVRTHQPAETLPLMAFERSLLHQQLLDEVPPQCLRLDAEVQQLRQTDGGAAVQVAGDELVADLVVAADGIHSGVRRQLWPNSAERFLNYSAWVGVADLEEPVGPGFEGLEGTMTLGRGRYFLIHPVGPTKVYWALGQRAERTGVRSPNELAEVLQLLAGWHEPIPQILAKTKPQDVKRLDIHEVPPLSSYVHGSIALLGDAAHAMSPDRGQGAAQGIEDAVVLASLLAEGDDVASALLRYDSARRQRAQSVARDARRVGQSVINAGPVAYSLMTAMLSLMPASLWQRATGPDANPIWAWAPPPMPNQS